MNAWSLCHRVLAIACAMLVIGILSLADSHGAPPPVPRTFNAAPPGAWGCAVDIEQHEGAMVGANLAKTCGDLARDRAVIQLLRDSENAFESFGQVSGPVYLLVRLKPCDRCGPRAAAPAEKNMDSRHAESARQAWIEQIVQRVHQSWQSPDGMREGQPLSCAVNIEQIPTGEVARATVVRSCGSPDWDRAVEDAVMKASPLPLPSDPAVFEPVVTISFDRS